MTPVFPGIIEAGKFVADEPRKLKTYLAAQFGNYKGAVELIIRKQKSQRSLKQNSMYWGFVLPIISEATGHTADELHEVFKRMFLPRRVVKYRDKEVAMPGSTIPLSTKEFTAYIERIVAEAADMGIIIPMEDLEGDVVPLPNEVEIE